MQLIRSRPFRTNMVALQGTLGANLRVERDLTFLLTPAT